MARKKEPAKPLFGLKHDFYESLDATLQAGVHFLQVVDTSLTLGQIQEPAAGMIKERLRAFQAALMGDISAEGDD